MKYLNFLKSIFSGIFALFFLLNFFACNQVNQKDYQDTFNEGLILTALLTPPPNPVGKCTTMMTKASECIPNASDKTTILNTLETTFNTNPGNSYGTIFKGILSSDPVKYTSFIYSQNINTLSFSDYCATAVVSSRLNNASEAFKDCVFSCQAENWSYYVSNSLCATGKTANLVTGSLGVGQNLCAVKCSKSTNN